MGILSLVCKTNKKTKIYVYLYGHVMLMDKSSYVKKC